MFVAEFKSDRQLAVSMIQLRNELCYNSTPHIKMLIQSRILVNDHNEMSKLYRNLPVASRSD